jgi:uncharacterized protein (TIGR02217 family)
MSQRIYPVFPGLSYTVTKTPGWATRMQRAVSGRTLRTSDYANPIWNFKLIYAVLHDSPWCSYTSPTELRTMMDFFNTSQGAFDAFLLNDPSDNTATGSVLGTGDNTNTQFQLLRALVPGGRGEAMIAPNVVGNVYLNDSPVAGWSVDDTTGLVTFATPPGPGVVVTADFTYYFRVYFPDALDFEEFAHDYWEIKQVKLTSVVL